MTDRAKGLMVAFADDFREDDIDDLMNAIRMLKGVIDVRTVTANPDDWMNRRRVRFELHEKLWKALNDD
jgi:uncharacterized protein YjiS (DUF1127 family)